MTEQIRIKEQKYKTSKYNTKDWENSVTIIRWEHNYENSEYIIDYKQK
jgi:hypothetical protein